MSARELSVHLPGAIGLAYLLTGDRTRAVRIAERAVAAVARRYRRDVAPSRLSREVESAVFRSVARTR